MLRCRTNRPAVGRWRMLNLTWVSFVLTFIVWFNLAPFRVRWVCFSTSSGFAVCGSTPYRNAGAT
jgi:nitrate/nitrite transporter NarK